MRFSMVVGPFDRDNRWLNEAHPEEACHRIDDCSRLCVYGDFLRWGSQPARHWGFVHSETHPLNGFYAVIGILHWMKLTVSQQIVLGLVVILVLCLLVVWAALRKPVERKKVFAMSSLILRHKKRAWDVAFRNPRPFSSVVGSWKVYADFSVTAKCTHDFLLPTRDWPVLFGRWLFLSNEVGEIMRGGQLKWSWVSINESSYLCWCFWLSVCW
jgi:hypothetical protein